MGLREIIAEMLLAGLIVSGGSALADDFEIILGRAGFGNDGKGKQVEVDPNYKPKDPKWKISVGVSRAWPKLEAVNAEITATWAGLREIAPNLEKFETWADVYTGMAFVNAMKRVSESNNGNLWLGFEVDYGAGRVATSDKADSIYGVPVTVDFTQDFALLFLSPRVEYQFNNDIAGFKPSIFAGPNWARLRSNADLYYGVLAVEESRKVHKGYDDSTIAYFAGISLEKDIGNCHLALSGRYDWATLEGNATITDSALGNESYKQPIVVDFSGPALEVSATWDLP